MSADDAVQVHDDDIMPMLVIVLADAALATGKKTTTWCSCSY